MKLEKTIYPTPKAYPFYRFMLCLAGWAILISLYAANDEANAVMGLMVFLLAYQAAGLLLDTDRQHSKELKHFFKALLPRVDALLTGLFVYLCFGDLMAAGLLAFMFITHMLSGNRRRLITDIPLAAMGIYLGSVIIGDIALILPEFLAFVLLIILAVYSSLIQGLGYNAFCEMRDKVESLSRQNDWLTLRTFRLSKYLSPGLTKAILTGKDVRAETQEKTLTIMFSDLEGFTKLAEELDAEQLTNLLNTYLTEMSEIAMRFGGTIDKFIGDAIMVFFGDPQSRGTKTDCITCVCMALAMQKRLKDLQERLRANGLEAPLSMRIGINTGVCKVGNFGTENRLDYTLLGREVNLASRLEASARPNSIVISEDTYNLVKDVIHCQDEGEVWVKGFSQPIRVYTAIDLHKNLQASEQHLSA